jgi:hypothetical protein
MSVPVVTLFCKEDVWCPYLYMLRAIRQCACALRVFHDEIELVSNF